MICFSWFPSLSFRALRGIYFWVPVLAVGLAAAQELPSGWRRPSPTEASGPWRDKSQTRFLVVKSDFDGDGKLDTAELLVNPLTNQFALFVNLASTGKWQLINKPFDLKSLDRFGINHVKPGKYETACGKGYGDWACAHGEPDWLKLSNPGIDFFYTESSDSIYYWDQQSKEFREVVMSD
jgi:hypothetical protein